MTSDILLPELFAPQKNRVAVAHLRSVFVLLFLACTALGINLAAAQSTPEGPVKVHGGSTTFFTQNKDGWVALPGAESTYCTPLKTTDINVVHISGFYDMTSKFLRGSAKNGKLTVNAYDWRIEFFGHDPGEVRQFRVRPQGIALQASRLDCKNNRTGIPSIRISPLGGASFYQQDLLPTQRYPGNKRFRAPQCNGEATDTCERTAQIRVFSSSDLNDTRPATSTFNCPDGACTLYVGKLQSISLAPTVRVTTPQKPGTPAAR